MAGNRVTLRDIAREVGTSAPTVSYVLSGTEKRYVNAELRDRVREAAERLGYVPRSEGRGNKRIALIMPQFENIFFRRLMAGAESVAWENGYVLTAYNSHDCARREAEILASLDRESYAGFLMIPNAEGHVDAARIAELKLPYVLAERPLPCEGEYDFVSMDNFAAGYLATKVLTEAGHRHIGMICWETRAITLLDRHLGYARALDEANVLYRPEYVRSGPFSEEAGWQMTESLLREQPSLTALVFAYHVPGLGGVRYLRKAGVRVPDDLSVVLVGDPTWAEMTTPAYTRIALPAEQIGKRALEQLLCRVRHQGGGPVREIVQGTLRDGASVRKVSG